MRSPYTYCGSRLWADHTVKGSLKEKLYEYWGTVIVNQQIYHTWRPYKRPGAGLLLTDAAMIATIDVFKPLVINMEELGIYQHGPSF
jgi:hypothetical protein